MTKFLLFLDYDDGDTTKKRTTGTRRTQEDYNGCRLLASCRMEV